MYLKIDFTELDLHHTCHQFLGEPVVRFAHRWCGFRCSDIPRPFPTTIICHCDDWWYNENCVNRNITLTITINITIFCISVIIHHCYSYHHWYTIVKKQNQKALRFQIFSSDQTSCWSLCIGGSYDSISHYKNPYKPTIFYGFFHGKPSWKTMKNHHLTKYVWNFFHLELFPNIWQTNPRKWNVTRVLITAQLNVPLNSRETAKIAEIWSQWPR